MSMYRRVVTVVLFFTVLGVAEAQKTRVAVMNFDYATVKTVSAAVFGTDQDIGKGIADLLVDKLVQDGKYSVIERKELDKIIAEQNFSNSDRADPSSAAKIGKVLGVDCIVIGSITQFGQDDKKSTIGGVGRLTDRFGVGGVSRSKSKAVVQITGRMINTSTAEILASASGHGEEERDGTGIVGSGGSYAGMAGGVLDMKSSNFRNTILGTAVTKAVNDMGNQLDQKAGALPHNAIVIEGMIADASPDGTVIINVGSKSGLKVGDRLEVKHPGRAITDPATGKVLRRMETPVGTIAITELDETSAVGKFVSPPATPAQVKDTVSITK
jgi:curli biogenesis system outer membrane secretion channel CsgG